MKKVSIILAALVLVTGISFAHIVTNLPQTQKTDKKDAKKDDKKEVKKVPAKKKAEKKDDKTTK